jgi:hypothetical protein
LLIRAVRERTGVVPHALAVAASIASVISFAWGLRPLVGGECNQLRTEPARYLRFAGLMFLRPFEQNDPALLPIGIALALGCVALATVSAWRTGRTLGADRLNTVVLCLAGFTSISAAMATLARACGGPDAGLRSAYVTYVLPFLVALYLTVSMRVAGRARQLILTTFLLALLVKEIAWVPRYSVPDSHYYAAGKRWWRECYFRTANPLWCNRSFEIHANPAATHMEEKMQFLREHRAGPFRQVR